MEHLHLRKSTKSDLLIFFQHQLDKEANHMAGFTAKDPTDQDAYMKKMVPLLQDKTITYRTIIYKQQVAGTVLSWLMGDDTQITYWIDKILWGKGITTQALNLFLTEFTHRPIYGRIAFDNTGSMRVLEKCGFKKIGTELFFANARGKEIEEYIFILE